uniref:Deoxyhexose isomerase n=1 Tax=Aeromicrobium erythreum TaxID=2041 RepID=Q5Y9G7_9ACTN|nr:deoxyhexose isomerase [Aeromicrobium erythreum]
MTETDSTATHATLDGRAQLGRRLQMVRGLLWGWGSNGDVLASVLSGSRTDLLDAGPLLRGEPVARSRTETWVVGDHATARAVLEDAAFGRGPARVPEWARAADVADATWCQPFQEAERQDVAPDVDPDGVVDRVRDAVGARGGRLDLVADLAWPAALAACDVRDAEAARAWRVAPDATLVPQRLAQTVAALEVLDAGHDVARLTVATLLSGVLVDAVLLLDGRRVAGLDDEPGTRAVVRETLRLAPTRALVRRTATAATTLGAAALGEGDEVIVVTAVADRDHALLEDPDAFRPDREPTTPSLSDLLAERDPLERLVRELAVLVLPVLLERPLELVGPVTRDPRSAVVRSCLSFPVVREES